MKNFEKYKDANARAAAYLKYCTDNRWYADTNNVPMAMRWLEDDADESQQEVAPCPFCGGPCQVSTGPECWVSCTECEYSTKMYNTEDQALREHNRVARR